MLMFCLTNKFNDLLVFFAPGAPLPETKSPSHFIKLICETGHDERRLSAQLLKYEEATMSRLSKLGPEGSVF